MRSRSGRANAARRARVILPLAEGATWATVCQAVGCSRGFIATWRHRFIAGRVAGLYSRHYGQAPLLIPRRQNLASWRPRGEHTPTGRRSGIPANWWPTSGAATWGSRGSGRNMASGRIGWSAIIPALASLVSP
ncbi:MAG: helix-turn-helix domain-containing protein [Nitrospira sp.]|nr:helix-turn-helix domain-containing protein [Nitrospira sp.]